MATPEKVMELTEAQVERQIYDATHVSFELKGHHVDALNHMQLSATKRDEMAASAFNSVLKGKIKAGLDVLQVEAFKLLRKHGPEDRQVKELMAKVTVAENLYKEF